MAKSWEHSDLTLYINDRAIFSMSATTAAATEKARLLYKKVLSWLGDNGLRTDPNKNKLMIFVNNCQHIGPRIWGTHYNTNKSYISTVQSLCYLGLYITPKLNWTHHITIMAHCARSIIRGIGLLGNSIYGLNLLNWCKAYNALIIPTLTYSVPVWYTRMGQKGLIQRLQVAQNKGIHKMTGCFRTTPVKPLHNLTRVPPIRYTLDKLIHSYSNRLQTLPANTKT